MKNKRLLVILVVFVVLGTLAVLGSVVFSIKKIEVSFTNELDYFVTGGISEKEATEKIQNSIKESLSKDLLNKNIFFSMSEKKIKGKIEKHEETYEGFRLRVTNVMAKFPNKLLITVRERYPVYRFTSGSKTVVLDGDLRVLDYTIPVDEYGAQRNLIDLSTVFDNVTSDDLKIGNYLTDSEKPERAEAIKKVVPFFWGEDSNEDAVTHYFSKFEFVRASGGNPDDAITYWTLKMTGLAKNELQAKNYYELYIVDVSKDMKAKLKKIWRLVENEQSNQHAGLGIYEVYEWTANKDNLRTTYYPWR